MVSDTNTKTIPNFRRTHDVLVKLGADVVPVYRALGLRDRDIQGDPSGVTVATSVKVLQRISEEQARPFLGLEIALKRDVSNAGALGYMARNAPDFERFLDILRKYLDLIMPGCRCDLVRRDLGCIWTYEVPGFSPSKCRQEIEGALMQFIGGVREVLELPTWRPEEVFFQHEEPASSDQLREAMCDNLHFEHHFNGVLFPTELLRHTISNADPQLLGILEQQVKHSIDQLTQGGTLIERLTFMITSRLGKTEISAEDIASRMGMSRRTLHRRLREQGTSFNEIRELAVLQISRKALTTTSVSITDLAQELGYSDCSAFDRAFKRLTGLSPRDYRHSHHTGW